MVFFFFWGCARCHRQREFRAQSHIGAGTVARSDLKNLERVWKHANIPQHRKILFFDTCVGSQLLYCMHTAWLNRAGLKKLDGFHARCLQKILGIPHPFISRVSNCVTCRQLMLFHKVMTLPPNDARRTCMFEADSRSCYSINSVDDVAAPKTHAQVYNIAIRVAINVDSLESMGSFTQGVAAQSSSLPHVVNKYSHVSCPCVTVHEAFDLTGKQ